MADNAIASGSAILTANADGLASGLDKGAKDVKTWATKVGGTLTNLFNSKGGTLGAFQNIGGAVTGVLANLATKAKSLLSGAGGAIGTAIGGPIGGAIGSAVGSAVGTLGETVVGAISAPFQKLDLFADINKSAKGLGMSASQLQGLTTVLGKAGIEGGQVGQIFAVMGKQISDVAAGKGKGAGLAFEALGIDAAALMKLKPDEQFLAIAEAFKKMPAGADQAAAAVHLFGGNAAAILPELQKGRDGIQGFIDTMKRTGAVLSDDQLQAAQNASRAWKDARNVIKGAWDGLVNRATLIAAPVVEFVGKAVSKIFSLLLPVFDWVGRAVAQVADIVTAVFEVAGKLVDEVVKEVQSLGAELFGMAGGMPAVEDVVVGFFRAIGVTAAYAWDVIRAGAGAFAFVAGKAIQFLSPMVDALKGTIKDMARLGFAVAVGQENDKMARFFSGIMMQADTFGEKMNEAGKDLEKWGETAVTTFGESADAFNAWLDNALKKKAKAGGGLGLLGSMLGGTGGPEASTPKLAAALSQGSKEAYSLILKNQLGMNGGKDPQKEMVKEQKKGNGLLKDGVKEAAKTNGILAALGVT